MKTRVEAYEKAGHMSSRSLWKAGFLAVALASFTLAPSHAETLRVMQGTPSQALNVPMNRAVVVESDVPFAELSIANPGIADISTLSDRSIYVLGKAPGRTTLTLLSQRELQKIGIPNGRADPR